MRAASRRIASTASGDGPTGFSLADSRRMGCPSSAASASSGGGTTYGSISARIERQRGGIADGVYHRSVGRPADGAAKRARAARGAPRGGPPAQDRMRAVTAPHIEVRAVAKQWRTRDHPVPALDGISLDVAPQEFLTVLGPSGCGKSTLLSIIGGLTVPDGGEVRIAGRPVSGPDPRQMAMVFQDPGLFPW